MRRRDQVKEYTRLLYAMRKLTLVKPEVLREATEILCWVWEIDAPADPVVAVFGVDKARCDLVAVGIGGPNIRCSFELGHTGPCSFVKSSKSKVSAAGVVNSGVSSVSPTNASQIFKDMASAMGIPPHLTGSPEPPPAPGSPEAHKNGCTCPTADNGYGRGSGKFNPDSTPVYWITGGCPLHNPESWKSP